MCKLYLNKNKAKPKKTHILNHINCPIIVIFGKQSQGWHIYKSKLWRVLGIIWTLDWPLTRPQAGMQQRGWATPPDSIHTASGGPGSSARHILWTLSHHYYHSVLHIMGSKYRLNGWSLEVYLLYFKLLCAVLVLVMGVGTGTSQMAQLSMWKTSGGPH